MPGKIVYCATCGEQIDASNSFCPYCGDVVPLPDENDYVPEEDISVDFTSELYEEVDGKIMKVNIKPEKPEESVPRAGFNPDQSLKNVHVVGASVSEASPVREPARTTQPSPEKLIKNVSNTGGYKPVNMHPQAPEEAMVTPVIKALPKRNSHGKIIAYDANYDHYWDDIKPAIDDVIKENHFDIILKVVGTFLLVLLLIIYLIFFLPSF